MTSFFGRRLAKGTNHLDVEKLKTSPYFLSNSNLRKLFKSDRFRNSKKNLEIGFGNGENISFQAQKSKDEFFLGCDPFISGGAKLFKIIESEDIKNIFITDLEFNLFYESIKNFFFKNIFILFPDPWPKKRHNKRRLVNESFLKKIELISNKNTKVIVATDDDSYKNQIEEIFNKNTNFKNFLEKKNDLNLGNVKIFETRYFMKAKNANNTRHFFIFKKNKL